MQVRMNLTLLQHMKNMNGFIYHNVRQQNVLNQACTGLWLAQNWFLEIALSTM